MRGITPGARAHTAVDIAGWLLFEILLVGLCEETLFRGLLLGVLQALSPSRLRIKKFSLSTAGVTIAIMFALAHVLSFATQPWPAALGQQLYAVTLGILYAWLRENSGSLLAPIIAHSLSDFVELYFPRKNGHEKRLDWLTYLGLLDKQKITSFSCW